jgi:hypothetical protein
MRHDYNVTWHDYTVKWHDCNVKQHECNVNQHDYNVTWHDYTVKRCAAKAIFYCPSISRRPRSQNTAKERAFIPEKDSKSLEKSSKNYKPLEK